MLTKKFEEKYPFIKTQTLRLGTFQLLTKIQTEVRARAFKGDVIEIAGVTGHILKKDGVFAKYTSPESRFYPDSVKDPDGTWTSFFINTHVLVYNTNMVKKDELPKTFQEVINPKWSNKILMSEDFDIFGINAGQIGFDQHRVVGFFDIDLRGPTGQHGCAGVFGRAEESLEHLVPVLSEWAEKSGRRSPGEQSFHDSLLLEVSTRKSSVISLCNKLQSARHSTGT